MRYLKMAKFVFLGPSEPPSKKTVVSKQRKSIKRLRWFKYSVALNIALVSYLAYLLATNN